MGRRARKQTEFLQMLDQCKGVVMKVCLCYGGTDRESMRDTYQDILCAMWESLPAFERRSDVTTWAWRVALNTAAMEHRRRRRMPQFVEMDESLYDTLADEAADMRHERLYSLIERLDPDDRQLVLLYIDRLPTSQIAEAMCISEDAVRQRLHRIKLKLIKLKERYYDDEEE